MTATTCAYRFLDASPCRKDALPGEENEGKCLFHSPDPNKDRGQLKRALAAKRDGNYQGYVLPDGVDFAGKTIARVLDFRSATFPPGAKADFTRATFQEGAEAYFGGATFQEGARADFREATFQKEAWASLSWATFQKGAWVYFREATFQEGAKAAFTGATFRKGAVAYFTLASFQEGAGAYFTLASFQEGAGAYFREATFQKEAEAYFTGASLDRLELPRDGKFQGRAVFKGAKFSQPVVFRECEFGVGSSFEDAELAPDSAFRFCDLSEVTFRGAAGLDEVEFDAVEWAQPPPPEGRWARRWERFLGGHQRSVIQDEPADRKSANRQDYEAAERIYRHLKKSYEARRDYPRAGDFHYGEMEMRRLAHTSRRRRWFFSLEALYWHLSGYGQQWRKAAFLFLVVLVPLFALLHAWAGFQVLRPDPSAPWTLVPWHIGLELRGPMPGELVFEGILESLLYSLRTATLLRDPAAAPLSLGGHALSTLESIFGPLLLGLMALAIRRRLQR